MTEDESAVVAAVARAADRGEPLRAKDLLALPAAAVRRAFESGAIERHQMRFGTATETVILPAVAPETDDEAWTEDELAYLDLSYQAGVSFTEMSRALARSGGTVLQAAWQRKLVRRRRESWDTTVPAWRVARLRQVLEDAQRRGAATDDAGDDLTHRALVRRFRAGRQGDTLGRHCHNWSEQEIAALKGLRAEGRSVHLIARRLRRTPSAVFTKISELELAQDKTWTEDEDRIVVAGVERGLTNRAISTFLPGRSHLAVKQRAIGLLGPRGAEPWSDEEKHALTVAVGRGENLREFCVAIGRPPGSAGWQMQQLGLTHPASTLLKQYQPWEDKRIVEGWKRKEKPREIAAELGRSLPSVYNRAFHLGVSGKGPGSYHKRVRRFEIDYIRARVAQGWSGARIAEVLGRTPQAVYKLADRYNIRWNRKGPRRRAA